MKKIPYRFRPGPLTAKGAVVLNELREELAARGDAERFHILRSLRAKFGRDLPPIALELFSSR